MNGYKLIQIKLLLDAYHVIVHAKVVNQHMNVMNVLVKQFLMKINIVDLVKAIKSLRMASV